MAELKDTYKPSTTFIEQMDDADVNCELARAIVCTKLDMTDAMAARAAAYMREAVKSQKAAWKSFHDDNPGASEYTWNYNPYRGLIVRTN